MRETLKNFGRDLVQGVWLGVGIVVLALVARFWDTYWMDPIKIAYAVAAFGFFVYFFFGIVKFNIRWAPLNWVFLKTGGHFKMPLFIIYSTGYLFVMSFLWWLYLIIENKYPKEREATTES